MSFTPAKFKASAFNCPLCGAYAHMQWSRLFRGAQPQYTDASMYWEANCSHCREHSLWRCLDTRTEHAEMLFPDNGNCSLPEEDMPDDVKSDYQEAARIITRSPRGAAALLRLALQNLLVYLGEEGHDLNKDIRNLAQKHTLPYLIKVADTVRLTGNASVHPSKMLPEDRDYVAAQMFDLLNYMVRMLITEPKNIQLLYEKTPEIKRLAAEKEDEKRTEKKKGE